MYGLGINALSGGVIPWTPANIPTALWLDASDSTTISHTTNLVDQWNDKSGNSRNFTGSGATRPTTNATTRNSLNVIDFAADYMNASAGAFNFMHDGTVDYSVHAVVQFGTTANPAVAYGLFGSNGTSSANKGASVWYDDRPSVPRNDNMVNLVSSGTGQVVNNVAGDNFCTANAYHLFRVRNFPTNSTVANRSYLQIDQGTEANNGIGTVSPLTGNSTYVMQIGSAGNNIFPLTGSIAEIIILDYEASSGTLASISEYLSTKWGV